MDELRQAAEQALKALEEINKLSVGENAICLPAEIDAAMEALRQALNETPPCKTHPDAPHGFDRNASHSADRYVCECEGWEPPKKEEGCAQCGKQASQGWALYCVECVGGKEWVGLTVEEAQKFYEKYTNREELIYAIDKFLEEKNT